MERFASILDYPHPGLDETVWDESGKLKEQNKKLILDTLFKHLKESNLSAYEQWITAINFVGGLTTYQYTSKSDGDIHIKVDLPKFIESEKLNFTEEQAHAFLDKLRKLWDAEKLKLPGTNHPIEYFFETPLVNKKEDKETGIYSLTKDEWTKPPFAVAQDFDLEEMKPFLIDMASVLAGEMDASFGTIKRHIQRIEELREVMQAWPKEKRKIFQEKIQTKLDEIETEIEDLTALKDKVVEDRKDYNKQSPQEVKFKYLQRFGYLWIIKELGELVNEGEVALETIPEMKEVINTTVEKQAQEVETPRLFIDFDKTIAHSEEDKVSGPMDGVKEAFAKFKEDGWEIHIYSCRANDAEGLDTIQKFLTSNELPFDEIFIGKPLGHYYIDDRALKFTTWGEIVPQVKKQASLLISAEVSGRLWIDPYGRIYPVPDIHVKWVQDNLSKLKKDYGVTFTEQELEYPTDKLLEAGWTRITTDFDIEEAQFGVEVKDLKHLPRYIDTILPDLYSEQLASLGTPVYFSDTNGNFVTVERPFPAQRNVNRALMSSSKTAELFDYRSSDACWLDPNGLKFPVRTGRNRAWTHVEWIHGHLNFLAKEYGIIIPPELVERMQNDDYDYHTINNILLNKGWVRMDGPSVQVNDLRSIPSFVFDNLPKSKTITFEDAGMNHSVHVDHDDAATGGQKTINRSLTLPVHASKEGLKYSSVQVNIPSLVSQDIVAWGVRNIPDEDLFIDEERKSGRELESHITIKYGLLTNEAKDVEKFFKGVSPVEIKLGKTKHFEPPELPFDVVTIEVISDTLPELNGKICGELECADGLIEEYRPHITVAYVKRGSGKKYVGDEFMKDSELTLDEVVFSPVEGERTTFMLGSKKEAGAMVKVGPAKVFKNPTAEQAKQLLAKSKDRTLRGLIDPNSQELFLWDAYYAEHDTVADALGIEHEGNVNDLFFNFPEHIDEFFKTMSDLWLEKKEADFMPSIVQAPDNPWQSDSDVEIPVDPDSTSEEQTYNNPAADKPRKSMWDKFMDFFRNKRKVKADYTDKAFWVDPSGKFYPVRSPKDNNQITHSQWIKINYQMLMDQYGLKGPEFSDAHGLDVYKVFDKMIADGWTRIGDSWIGGTQNYGIQLRDIRRIPSYIENWVAENFVQGQTIEVSEGNNKKLVQVPDPSPSLQKAVNQALRNKDLVHANLKEAGRGRENASWVDPNGKIYPISGLNAEYTTHADWMLVNLPLLKKQYGMSASDLRDVRERVINQDYERVTSILIARGWARIGDVASGEGYGVEVSDLRRIQPSVFDFLMQHADIEEEIAFEDLDRNHVSLTGRELPDGQKAINRELSHSVNAFLQKHAYLEHAYWIDPKGKVYEVRGEGGGSNTHMEWLSENSELLETDYNFNPASYETEWEAVEALIEKGWVRIGDSRTQGGRTHSIMVSDIRKIPSFVDNLVAQFYKPNQEIEVTDVPGNYVILDDPFPNLEKAVRNALREGRGANVHNTDDQGVSLDPDEEGIDDDDDDGRESLEHPPKPNPPAPKPQMSLPFYKQQPSDMPLGLAFSRPLSKRDIKAAPPVPPQTNKQQMKPMGLTEIFYFQSVAPQDVQDEVDLLLDTGHTTEAWVIMEKYIGRRHLNPKGSLVKIAGDEGFWIDPNGKIFKVRDDSTEYQTHNDWIIENEQLLQNEYNIDPKEIEALSGYGKELNNMLIEKGWVRIGDSGSGDIGIRVPDLRRIPRKVEEVLMSIYNGGTIALEDLNGKHTFLDKLDEDLQKAVNLGLRVYAGRLICPDCGTFHVLNQMCDNTTWDDPRQHLEPFKPLPTTMQQTTNDENLGQPGVRRFMGRPQGENYSNDEKIIDFLLNDEKHKKEADLNKEAKVLKIQPANSSTDILVLMNPTKQEVIGMIKRIKGDHTDLRVIKGKNTYVWEAYKATHEDVLDKLVESGYEDSRVERDYIFGLEDVQEAFDTFIHASIKEASPLSDILKLVQETGGATYNLSKGNLSGTKTYAVATHPDRAVILDHTPSEKELSDYVAKNEDLLNDETSLGVWSSNGKVYLDIVSTLEDMNKAIELGKNNNQIAIFDLQNLKEIPTGGTGEVPKKASVEMLQTTWGPDIKVLVDPTLNEALSLLKSAKNHELRWGITENNLFLWDAYDFDHEGAADGLGLEEMFVDYGYANTPAEVEKKVRGRVPVPFQPTLVEAKTASSNIIEMDPWGSGKSFPVFVNPSRNQVVALIRKYPEGLRVIDGTHAKYVWEAYIATHDQVLENLVESGYEEYAGVRTDYVNAPSEVDDFTWKSASLKKASLPSRFWIDPNGVRYDAGTHHGAWIKVNKDLLAKKYGIKYNGLGGVTWQEMMDKGWVRVSNEPAGTGFHIQVPDMTRIPKFVDDLIAEYYDRGGVIGLGDQQGRHVEINNPFPSIQKVVNRALQRGNLKGSLSKSSKVEDIDGVKVYVNPSQEELSRISKTFHQEFMNAQSIRALIDTKTGDIYAWDGWFQEHNTMGKNLGLSSSAYHWDGSSEDLPHLYALQEDMRRGSEITAGNLSNTYTDQQMEQIYQEQHEYGDSSGGGNVYHDFSNSSTDYPKEPGPYRIRLDLLNNPADRQFPLNLPSYEVTWFTSMPQG